MSIHSNAFNFASFVKGSVDPRTGQFGVSIELPALNANALCGPELPLRLGFDAIGASDVGLGIGWSLKLSRLNLRTGMLDLHSGEHFKVHDNGPGQEAVIPERKLASFTYRNITQGGRTRVRIAHKSGLVEVLEAQAPEFDVALPVRVCTPSGHGIELRYETVQGQPRLSTIFDDTQRQLLAIDYRANSRVYIDVHPNSTALARYTLHLEDDRLRALELPPAAQGSWAFKYRRIDGLHVITSVTNPNGGMELLQYEDAGHALPGVARAVPYVREHVRQPDPLDPSTHIKTTYAFSSNNFLGNGAGVDWREDGLDNLYRSAQSTFTYDSTATLHLDGAPLRTVKTTFNRYHLVTEQVTTQAGCIETVTTDYHHVPGLPFADQPAHFQLPRQIKKEWTLKDQPSAYRVETAETHYDQNGNLIEEISATGLRTVRTFYPKTESDGCPADPEGFVRNLESETVHPAPHVGGDTQPVAPVRRVRYRYKHLPGLDVPADKARIQADGWLVVEDESTHEVTCTDQGEVETEQLLITRRYLDKPALAHLHGRLDEVTHAMNGVETRQSWRYEIADDPAGAPTLLRTRETYHSPCGTLTRSTYSTVSMLHGQVMETTDEQGQTTGYDYDSLGRLTLEITAPDDPIYRAVRRYGYPLLSEAGRVRRSETVTDVKGVVTRTVYDGLNQPIRVEREVLGLPLEEGQPAPRITRVVSEQGYDSAGRLTCERAYDYLPDADGQLPPTPDVVHAQHYGYDGWGHRCSVTDEQGLTQFTFTDLFGDGGDLVTRWEECADEPGVRRNVSISQYNLSSRPIFEYRLIEEEGQRPVQIGRRDYRYDGLGRCTSETLRFSATGGAMPQRTTGYQYDFWDRMDKTVRPDRTYLQREFAKHTNQQLVTAFKVGKPDGSAAKAACEREFDGLDRLVKLNVGPRIDAYEYRGSSDLVRTRSRFTLSEDGKAGRKRNFDYEHMRQLTTDPTSVKVRIEDEAGRQTPGASPSTFAYDAGSAQITAANNDAGARSYDYSDQGHLIAEEWTAADGKGYRTAFGHSLEGRMAVRTADGMPECRYDYDASGRLASVEQGALHTSLKYNAQGLLVSTTTQDSDNGGRTVKCDQAYDDLGREIRRTMYVDGVEVQAIEMTWYDTDMVRTRTLTRQGLTVLDETFEYDERDRLVRHTCTGEALPCNAKGRPIIGQSFRFDEMDNLTRCRTEFADGKMDQADFEYAKDGSFKLLKVSHRLTEDYPAEQSFAYDELGNMLNDEQGRALVYDDLGRLSRVMDSDGVSPLVEYRYDGHDSLVKSLSGGKREIGRRFLGQQLVSTSEGDLITHYLHAGTQPLGTQREPADPQANTLLHSDRSGSVLAECDTAGIRHAQYTAYGERPDENGLHSALAFNGEVREAALGWYLLGRGYRAYNPTLMRFHSPDSLAPEEAGVNPYLYALGNPVTWRDPTGHRAQWATPRRDDFDYIDPPEKPDASVMAWIGLGVSTLLLVATVWNMPLAAPKLIGLQASYVMSILGATANAAGVAIQAYQVIANDDDKVLTYVGMGLGLAGGLVGFKAKAHLLKQVSKAKRLPLEAPLAGMNDPVRMTGHKVSDTFGRFIPRSGGQVNLKYNPPVDRSGRIVTTGGGTAVTAPTSTPTPANATANIRAVSNGSPAPASPGGGSLSADAVAGPSRLSIPPHEVTGLAADVMNSTPLGSSSLTGAPPPPPPPLP